MNKDITPTRILVDMEEAIRAMFAKNYGHDGHSAVTADLILCVVDPKFREVWANA